MKSSNEKAENRINQSESQKKKLIWSDASVFEMFKLRKFFPSFKTK